MKRKVSLIAGLTLIFCISTLGPVGMSFGQRVWVGGGGVRVRAPFVRVDVDPYGGVSVRAPFTSIDTPGRGYYYEPYPVVIQERIVEPSFPAAAEFAAMDDAQLRDNLLAISESLQRRLRRFDTGETWQRYLRLPYEALDSSSGPAERRDALIKLLDRFHNVMADPQYSMIAQLPAFVAMEAALAEVVSRPDNGQANGDSGVVEDLPLPTPERPVPPQRNGPFLRPKSAQ